MSRYEIYQFLHVAAAIAWIGGGLMLGIIGAMAMRSQDPQDLGRLGRVAGSLSNVFFIPASLVVFVMGILMVADGPAELDHLWIILGLVGYAVTFLTGAAVVGPRTKKISAEIEANQGVVTPSAEYQIRQLLNLLRIDYVVLYVVVFDMVIKPTSDDPEVLAIMAAALVAGVVWALSGYRSVPRPDAAAATA